MFKIVEKNPNCVRVELSGDLLAGTIADLRETLYAIGESGVRIDLDFRDVKVVDSTAIGLFLATQRVLGRTGGRLALCNLPSDLLNTLKMMRLDHVFEIGDAHPDD